MSNVTIISDGTSSGTKVKVGKEFLKGITAIDIEPMRVDEPCRARITVDVAALKLALADAEILCSDPVLEEKIKEYLLTSA
ncbi:MAG: hypothetical protein GY942_03455, partial [Aestuariibacter sp.]|nr:hypothetical protein [Aestuariibacter sp.]